MNLNDNDDFEDDPYFAQFLLPENQLADIEDQYIDEKTGEMVLDIALLPPDLDNLNLLDGQEVNIENSFVQNWDDSKYDE